MTTQAVVQMWGNTRAVRIPKALALELGLDTGTPVALQRSKNGLLVKPLRRKPTYTLANLLAQCPPRNPHREQLTSRRGNEIF